MPAAAPPTKEDPTRFNVAGGGLRVIAAGDPLWKGLEPDDAKAYVGFRICKSLPSIAGPESHGRWFGTHPQVIANSYRSLLHQQTNLEHLLKFHGARRDRIVGTVVGVAFPEKPGRGWEIPESVEKAPMIEVVAVLHKYAEGVDHLIGGHQSSKKPKSVSIEAWSPHPYILDPGSMEFVPLAEAEARFAGAVTWTEEKGWQAGLFEGRQLAFAPGGTDKIVQYEGVGYTGTPAERPAHITEIRAELADGVRLAAMARADWEPGMEVRWTPVLWGRDAGRGTVVEVITEGEHRVGGVLQRADAAHPLLTVKVAGKRARVTRTAASLKKISK
jgi:hypothetical protein